LTANKAESERLILTVFGSANRQSYSLFLFNSGSGDRLSYVSDVETYSLRLT